MQQKTFVNRFLRGATQRLSSLRTPQCCPALWHRRPCLGFVDAAVQRDGIAGAGRSHNPICRILYKNPSTFRISAEVGIEPSRIVLREERTKLDCEGNSFGCVWSSAALKKSVCVSSQKKKERPEAQRRVRPCVLLRYLSVTSVRPLRPVRRTDVCISFCLWHVGFASTNSSEFFTALYICYSNSRRFLLRHFCGF